MLIFPIIGLFFRIEKVFFGYKFSLKEIFLLWSSQVLTVVIIINLILKNFWGRARPGDVVELGGENVFTPWYEFSNACDTNCSFVSGDSSVGFSIIVFYLITKNNLFFYFSIFSGLFFGFIRILAGGHFLSDVIFSGLIVILLNLLLYKFYKRYYE